MPNKSISFNEEMLKAILDGRKTQTRRICQGAKFQVGDTVYVKEPWKIKRWYQDDGELDIEYLADGKIKNISTPCFQDHTGEIFNEYWIESCDDYDEAGIKYNEDEECYEIPEINPCRLRPAEEMPEYFSRLSLKVTAVRKEKLQDITEQDAIAEGFYLTPKDIAKEDKTPSLTWFRGLWDSIYSNNESKQWEANPWVWVYEFEVIND